MDVGFFIDNGGCFDVLNLEGLLFCIQINSCVEGVVMGMFWLICDGLGIVIESENVLDVM